MRRHGWMGLLAAGMLAFAVAGGTLAGPPPGTREQRVEWVRKSLRHSPDMAGVVTATFLGGPGTEWLAAGGFAPDGKVLLAGCTVDAEVVLGRVKAAVIGADAPGFGDYRPQPIMQEVRVKGPRGQPPQVRLEPRKDKAGNVLYGPLSWRHRQATGFVAVCAPDLRQVLSVFRLPRGAGSITSLAVASDGAVYIAGGAGDCIANLGRNLQTLPVEDCQAQDFAVERTYLARLSPDVSRAEWVRVMNGKSHGPKISLARDGRIKFVGPDIRTFTPDGRLERTVTVPGGLDGRSAVNPVDGTWARGGDHLWGTGREPYRSPYLNIFKPDGDLLYELYHWPGPLMGITRAVSDSSVRKVMYDDRGHLLLYGWSDGGNTVMQAQPTDFGRGWPARGLGMTTAGAGATSFVWLVRLETKDYQIVSATLWCSSYMGKANGADVNALALAADGSVCFAGSSAWGLAQTANKLGDGEPGGPYVAVLSADMTSVRFSSAVPGAGKTDVGGDTEKAERWGIASGTVGGRPKALFVCGAVDKEEIYELVSPCPVKNAVQPAFAGGSADGYAILLDLGPGAPAKADAAGGPAGDGRPGAAVAAPAPPGRSPAATAGQGAQGAWSGVWLLALAAAFSAVVLAAFGARRRWALAAALGVLAAAAIAPVLAAKGEPATPPEGHTFYVHAAYPKYYTVMASFRDAAGKMWPSFTYGRPLDGGRFTYSAARPQMALTVVADQGVQTRGDQGRRVLGELIKPGTDSKGRPTGLPPEVRLTVRSMSPWKTEETVETDSRGRERRRTETFSILDGELSVAGRAAPVKARCTVRYGYPRAAAGQPAPTAPNQANLAASFTVRGSALGLRAAGATGDILVRMSWEMTAAATPPPARR